MDFSLLKRRKRGWMKLRVSKIVEETHDTVTLYLEDADDGGRAFDYFAGQYLTFKFLNLSEKPVIRSYTLSSCPKELGDIAFTVKRVHDGFVSKWLVEDCKEGDILSARGPIGRFCCDPDTDKKHIFMVAAGSGVTPFISMMKEHAPDLGKGGAPEKMTLLVSYKSQNDLICWETLESLKKIDGINVITTLSQEKADGFLQGRINNDMLSDAMEGIYDNVTTFTCGPDAMMNNFRDFCLAKGIDESQVKMESFDS